MTPARVAVGGQINSALIEVGAAVKAPADLSVKVERRTTRALIVCRRGVEIGSSVNRLPQRIGEVTAGVD
jgi:hypothetical protein